MEKKKKEKKKNLCLKMSKKVILISYFKELARIY